MALRVWSRGSFCANFLRTFPRPREQSGLRGYQGLRRLNGLTSQALRGQRTVCRFAPVACKNPTTFRAYSTSSDEIIWKSPWEDIVIPENESLPQHVMKHFSTYGDDVALVDGPTGRTVTFNQVKDGIIKTASALTKQGYKKGDVAVIFSPNNPEFAIFYLAWISIGGIASCVNNLYTAVELQSTLSRTSAKLAITVPELTDTVKTAAKTCPDLKEIIVFGEAEGCRPLSNLLEDDGKAFPENVDINPKEDLAALPFSSGTTGLPKGVMLTHYNILANVDIIAMKEVVGLGREDAIIGSLPFFHIYGQVVIMLSALFSGSKTIALPKFDAELFLQSMEKHKVAYLHLVPPMILFLANHPMVDNYDFSSVHTLFTGAAPAGGEIIEKACKRLNIHTFRQGFGVTEGSSATHINPTEGFKYHTCGVPIQNTAHKIIDLETGKDLGVGEEGEFLIRGPQIMKGYFQNPEATASTLVDGWLHTGDIGYTDEDGHLIISDRLKELIKFKGFQVAPAELENLLITHPGILDAAVIGKPDERVGELPRAYVVKHPDHNITDEDIHEFLEGKVADFKKLAGGIEFRDSIPKSAAGKILRRELKAELLEQMK